MMAIVFSQSLFDVEETADKVIVWQIETWGDNKFGSQIVHELDGRHWNLVLLLI